jgi:UDP-N-acetylmuramate-alanine ligase
VLLASPISLLKNWFKWSPKGGTAATSSRSREKFLRWRAAQDHEGRWRVVDDNNLVVCSRCSQEDAEEIANAHNKNDPIQSYTDWLYYKDK